tara:strand:- start:103 stop:225 length:123 start_codon:yes stop_codon:yes gene_type:complete
LKKIKLAKKTYLYKNKFFESLVLLLVGARRGLWNIPLLGK